MLKSRNLLSSSQQQLSVALQGLLRALRAQAAPASCEQVICFARWCFSSCAFAEVNECGSLWLPASIWMWALHQQLCDIWANYLLKQGTFWDNRIRLNTTMTSMLSQMCAISTCDNKTLCHLLHSVCRAVSVDSTGGQQSSYRAACRPSCRRLPSGGQTP